MTSPAAMTIAPVAPFQPQPQGRRRYDATDIALLIEFSQVWMETEDSSEDNDLECFNETMTTESAPQVATQDSNHGGGVVDLTMEEEPASNTTSSGMTMVPRDAASVVSVESFECHDMSSMDDKEDEEESPKKDGKYRESFLSTCWEIDSFMDNVQVGLA